MPNTSLKLFQEFGSLVKKFRFLFQFPFGSLLPYFEGNVMNYCKHETMVKERWFIVIAFCLALDNILFSGATH